MAEVMKGRGWRTAKPGERVREHTREVVTLDMARVELLEREVAEIKSMLRPSGSGEVLAPVVSNILDRMGSLEQLSVDSMDLPQALANQLRLTSEIMEVHREASERAAAAQGGLATVVESMRVDMEALTQAVAHLRSKIENRESYAAGLLGRRRAG